MNKKEIPANLKAEKKLSKEEILVKLHSTLMVLQMKNKMGQLVQTHQIKQVKKDIARLFTKINSLTRKEIKNK